MAKVKAQVKLFKDPQRAWVMILMDQNRVKADAVDKFENMILHYAQRNSFKHTSLF